MLGPIFVSEIEISLFDQIDKLSQNTSVHVLERELALLVALQGESIWKGCSAAASAAGNIH